MPCDTFLDRVVDRYIKQAVVHERKDRAKDKLAVRVAGGGGENLSGRDACMQKWLHSYGVLRFITTPERKRISKQIVKFYDCKKNIPEDSECRIKLILEEYKKLNGIVRNSKNKKILKRSFLSLTSKALWCKYPEIIPIYDKHAKQAIYMIAKIENNTEEYDPNTHDHQPPNGLQENKSENDCVEYEIFIRNYFPLYDKVYQKISSHSLTKNCPHVIRVFDKILWLYGAIENDIPHKPEVYANWAPPTP